MQIYEKQIIMFMDLIVAAISINIGKTIEETISAGFISKLFIRNRKEPEGMISEAGLDCRALKLTFFSQQQVTRHLMRKISFSLTNYLVFRVY